jgi:hypothetical protein
MIKTLKELKKFVEENSGKKMTIDNGYCIEIYNQGNTANFKNLELMQFTFRDTTVLIDLLRDTAAWTKVETFDLTESIDIMNGFVPTELISAIKNLKVETEK